jgi:hypothetical protein
MDEIEDQLSGGKPGHQITDSLIRALKEVESSGNPRAINPDSGASGAFQFMPATVKMLKKQGIDFNPFDEKESERAARTYLQILRDKNGGDLNKALAQYGGHITKDPTNYLNKIYTRMEKNAAAAPKSKAQPGDEIEQALLGKIEREPEPPAPPPLKLNQLSQFGSLGVPEGDLVRKAMKKYFAPKPAETAPAAAAAPAEKPRPYSRPEDIPGNLPAVQYKAPSMTDRLLGIPEAALATVSGAVAGTVAAPVGLAREMISGVPKEKTAEQIIQAGTYAPRTESGQEYVTEIGKVAANLPAFLPSMGKTAPLSRTATAAEQTLRDQFAAKPAAPRVEPGIGAPTAAAPAPGQPKPRVVYSDVQRQLAEQKAAKEAALTEFANAPTQRELQAAKAQQSQASVAPLAGSIAPPGSVGAAAVTDVSAINAAISQLGPQYQAQFRGIDPRQINLSALESHLQADRLGLGYDFFTEGQALQDPRAISQELNERGKFSWLGDRFSQQDPKLKTAMDAIHDRATQNEVGGTMYDHGVEQIKQYTDLDATVLANIDQKYQALRDAAGGEFPIDTKTWVENSRKELKRQLLSKDLTTKTKEFLDEFANGEKMSFEEYTFMLRRLGKEIEAQRRAGDGNAAYAAGVVKRQLEELPLEPSAENLRSYQVDAVSAARKRFEALENDPAYDAAVHGEQPDSFMKKYVIDAPAQKVKLMRDTFGDGSIGALNVESALINYLREKGGLIEKKNVNQATYNNTFRTLEEKIKAGAKPETVDDLRVLGDVLYKTKSRPTGSFANESNTYVAQIAEQGVGGAAKAGDVYLMAKGLPPLASKAVGWAGKKREEFKMKKRLEPLAGVKKRD